MADTEVEECQPQAEDDCQWQVQKRRSTKHKQHPCPSVRQAAPVPATQQTKATKADIHALKNLVQKQYQLLKQIFKELQQYGRKEGHWIWYVFPTDKAGESDPAQTHVTQSTAPQLCVNGSTAVAWQMVLEKICDLIEENGTKVLPRIDHSRVHWFLQFWNALDESPEWMQAVCERLGRFLWHAGAEECQPQAARMETEEGFQRQMQKRASVSHGRQGCFDVVEVQPQTGFEPSAQQHPYYPLARRVAPGSTKQRTACTASKEDIRSLDALVQKQRRLLGQILKELHKYGCKEGHWIWYVFPTDRAGDCDPANTRVTQSTAPRLCANDSTAVAWQMVLEQICDLIEEKGMKVLPRIDHGRVYWFIRFWNALEESPEWMLAVCKRLGRFHWPAR